LYKGQLYYPVLEAKDGFGGKITIYNYATGTKDEVVCKKEDVTVFYVESDVIAHATRTSLVSPTSV
jgi:hypothetical protein